MQAMCLNEIGAELACIDLQTPIPREHELLLKVLACGVCRTDLHVCAGELPNERLPIIPGHEVIARVEAIGSAVSQITTGDIVGVPWLAKTCGKCKFCKSERENLCGQAEFTGYTRPGGYAEYMIADSRFCLHLSSDTDPVATAPLMCAGLIGWRSLRMCGEAQKLGIYGFGAAGHIICQIAIQQDRQVYAFTRDGDGKTQQFARELGAVWSGDSSNAAPEKLDAAIIFAPVGELVPMALKATDKGGIVVCGGIHMSDIPSFPYAILWEERAVKSVANLTRKDGVEFAEALKRYKVKTQVHEYKLENANDALNDLRYGRFEGAAVLVPPQ